MELEPTTTVGEAKEIVFAQEISNGKRIRFIYAGKSLENDKTLEFYKIQSKSYVHALI